jgi:response regulator RpfG family c-di-GMP phosphodiesterase
VFFLILGGKMMKAYSMVPSTYQIMIVDDEDTIRLVTKLGLETLGYRVVDFESPTLALEYYENNYRNIDFVILDMMMPDMNGGELFYYLKKINPFISAVVLSGFDDVEVKFKHLIEDGLHSFLRKPISIEDLNNEIQKILMLKLSINSTKGLSTVLNNDNIYLKLLRIYHEEYADLEKKVSLLLNANDLFGIESLVHKIKGISLNLGAGQVYNLSTILNRKFKENDVVIEDILTFIKYHNLVIKDIERILGVQDVQRV